MSVGRYLLRRALGFAFVLLGLAVVIFVIARVVPGDPARIALGPLATQELVQQLHVELGLDRPAIVQFGAYIGGLLHGDLGQSLVTNRSVAKDIGEALPATLELVLLTLLLIVTVAMPLGMLAARRHNSAVDNISRIVSLPAAADFCR